MAHVQGTVATDVAARSADVEGAVEPQPLEHEEAHGPQALRTGSPESLVGPASPRIADSPDTHAAIGVVDATPDVAAPAAKAPRRAASHREHAGWSARYALGLISTDSLIGLVAVWVALALPISHFTEPKSLVLALGAAVAWPLAISLNHGYERSNIGVGSDELRAVFRALVLSVAAGGVPSALTNKTGVVTLCVIATPIACAASILARFAARRFLHHQQRLGRNVRRAIVVGSAHAAADLALLLDREPQCGMRVVGACVPRAEVANASGSGPRIIGDLEQVPRLIDTYSADVVAVAGGSAFQPNSLRELSWALEGSGVELLVHPGLVEVAGPRMHIRPYVGLPLLHVEQPHFSGWRRFVKRATDMVLGGLGVLLLSPLLLVIALAIKLGDRGPVIFRQARVGLDGSTFTMLKFRSMHVDAEQRLAELRGSNPHIGVMFKMEDDPRITPVGRLLRKYSLDELPQLFNVLQGSMSLVGPRPPLQSEVDVYEPPARRRLLVTPGVTGLWQVSGRSLLSWEETVRLDLRYVENWTLTLDLLILWKTFFAVVAKRGAF